MPNKASPSSHHSQKPLGPPHRCTPPRGTPSGCYPALSPPAKCWPCAAGAAQRWPRLPAGTLMDQGEEQVKRIQANKIQNTKQEVDFIKQA